MIFPTLTWNTSIVVEEIARKQLNPSLLVAPTNEGVGDGDLQPHTVSHLQPGLWASHGLGDGPHISVDGQVEVIETCSGSADG